MPHQCVRCGKFYGDGSSEILYGCGCGGRLFFYIKAAAIEKAKELSASLSKSEKAELEKDVLELVDVRREAEEQPVVLDFEAIRVLEPGKFELDLIKLFKNEPLIYKLGEGKYVIDLAATFAESRKKSR